MAFLKRHKEENEGVCDNCGKDLDEAENVVEAGVGHEFCSEDCRQEYEEEHAHEEDDEANVCEFC